MLYLGARLARQAAETICTFEKERPTIIDKVPFTGFGSLYLFRGSQSRSPTSPVGLASCANHAAPIRSLAANFQTDPYRLRLE